MSSTDNAPPPPKEIEMKEVKVNEDEEVKQKVTPVVRWNCLHIMDR